MQLTDTYNGAEIWTELYHRPYLPSNLFEVADNIITHIIASLGDFNGLIVQQLRKGFSRNKLGKSNATNVWWYNDFYSTFNKISFNNACGAMELAVDQDPSNEVAGAFLGELSLVVGFISSVIQQQFFDLWF